MSENINEGLPVPQTRSEKFLAKIAGEDQALPIPQSREELFLKAIAENGSGGGGGGNDGIVVVHGEINLTDFYNATNDGDNEFIIYPDKTYAEMSEADVLIACLRFDNSVNTADVCFYSTGTPATIGNKTFLETGIFGRETLLAVAAVDDLEFYLRVDKDNNNQPILVLLCLKAGSFDTFTVTLTPTAQDFSGTMDKTPAEIRAAYDAGQNIVFSVPSMNASAACVQAVTVGSTSINCTTAIYYTINGQDVLIRAGTSDSDQTYDTRIYPLTPMS